MSRVRYVEPGIVIRLLSLILFIIAIILIVSISISGELPGVYKVIGYIISIMILIPSIIGLITKYVE